MKATLAPLHYHIFVKMINNGPFQTFSKRRINIDVVMTGLNLKGKLVRYVHISSDQRITQDVEKMCNILAVKLTKSLLTAPFVIAYYTYKTWETYVQR